MIMRLLTMTALLAGCATFSGVHVQEQANTYVRQVNGLSDRVAAVLPGLELGCRYAVDVEHQALVKACKVARVAYRGLQATQKVAFRAIDTYRDTGMGSDVIIHSIVKLNRLADGVVERVDALSKEVKGDVEIAIEEARGAVGQPPADVTLQEGSASGSEEAPAAAAAAGDENVPQ